MFRPIAQTLLWLLFLGTLIAILLIGLGVFAPQTLIAAVSELESAPGQVLYRSQYNLKDQSGQTWQIILLKHVQPGHSSLYLRLVGLPGAAEIVHPKALKLTTRAGKVFTAADTFLEEAPAPTVGQYNVRDVLSNLPVEALRLDIPLAGQTLNLQVPAAVVQEWRQVVAKTSSNF